MSQNEVNLIKQTFQALALHPTYLEHEPVITSEDAAKTRGFELKQGIKAILLTNGTDYVIVNIPADQKVNIKSVASTLSWSKGKTRMATPEEVIVKTGCDIGAVPPFGHKQRIPLLIDQKIYDNDVCAFNIGLRTHSVKLKTKEMKLLFDKLRAKEGQFTM